MLTTSTVFRAELEKLITEAINYQIEIISSPNAVIDFQVYKHHLGFIAGLRHVLELCDEAESNINKRERGA
jgi:hypothetical protein